MHSRIYRSELFCVQSSSHIQIFAIPWTAACQVSLSFIVSWSLFKFLFELVMPSNHLILCRPLLLLHSIFPSVRVFSNESALRIRWPKYQSFNFSTSPSNEYSGLIAFRIDWFDLAVQGTLKSLLQHHNSKAWILRNSAFFMVQLAYAYMTTGKTATAWEIFGKVMSLLFSILSSFVIAFLPRSKHLNIMDAVTICSDFAAQENKVCQCFLCFPFICHEVMGLDAMNFIFMNVEF